MAKIRDEYRYLSGLEKAAIFLLALDEDQSSALFEKMHDDEVRDLSQAMATLGNVNSDVIERLFLEFADRMTTSGSLMGSYENTERLLTRSFDKERVDQIMEEIRGPAGRTMWEKLGNVSEAVLANYLKNEYPQTVAVILSKLRSEHAGRVLSQLPENFAMEVIMRMLRMEVVQRDVLESIEKTLRQEFMTNLARSSRRDSHELMADIFNSFDRGTEARFMSALEERNRESAERIQALMFTFDDLNRLDGAGIQVLLRQVEKDVLALALKGAADEVKELFFENMSERAGKMMREDMEAMGAVRLKDVDEAQATIVALAKSLAEAGEIVMAGGEGDEVIY